MGTINNKWLDFYSENNTQNRLSVRRCKGRMMNKVTTDNQHWKVCWAIVILNGVLGTRQTRFESQFCPGNVGGQLIQLFCAWVSSSMRWRMFILTHLRIKEDTTCKSSDMKCAFRSLAQCGWSTCHCCILFIVSALDGEGPAALNPRPAHRTVGSMTMLLPMLTCPHCSPEQTLQKLFLTCAWKPKLPVSAPRPRQHNFPLTLDTLQSSHTESCGVSRIVYTG